MQTGTIEERALIHVILSDECGLDAADDRASMLLFQGAVRKRSTVEYWVHWTREVAEKFGGIEPTISRAFISQAKSKGLLKDYLRCLSQTRGRRSRLPEEVQAKALELTSRFRTELARASVDALEPDLIILDEFQRFRDLLDPQSDTEAAELARALFEFGEARVLLLSATPIKSFTFAEEASSGDDHERDLRKILDFLTTGSDIDSHDILVDLAEYRRCAVTAIDVEAVRRRVEKRLMSVMCRTERPRVSTDGGLAEEDHPVGPVPGADLAGWAGLHGLAATLDAPVTLDYWKSAPYFANFLEGYKLGEKLRERLSDGPPVDGLRGALSSVQTLDTSVIEQRAELDLGNARLRALAAKTLDQGLHKLLWVPPSLPYHQLDGPYRDMDALHLHQAPRVLLLGCDPDHGRLSPLL